MDIALQFSIHLCSQAQRQKSLMLWYNSCQRDLFANTLFNLQSPSFEETRKSPGQSPSSRIQSPPPRPSPPTLPATTPMLNGGCMSTSSATTPMAAYRLALTVRHPARNEQGL